MSLASQAPVGFIPTADAQAARIFYQDVLGLGFESDDQFALVFRVGPAPGGMLRIVRVGPFSPAAFTIYGWEVAAVGRTVEELTQRGVLFLQFESLEQDEHGVWTSPGGSKVAWFKDPDGNTLSLSEHVR